MYALYSIRIVQALHSVCGLVFKSRNNSPSWGNDPREWRGQWGREGEFPGGGGKETYGTWDQSLNLMPAMSRSTEPRPKQWILLARSRYKLRMKTESQSCQSTVGQSRRRERVRAGRPQPAWQSTLTGQNLLLPKSGQIWSLLNFCLFRV